MQRPGHNNGTCHLVVCKRCWIHNRGKNLALGVDTLPEAQHGLGPCSFPVHGCSFVLSSRSGTGHGVPLLPCGLMVLHNDLYHGDAQQKTINGYEAFFPVRFWDCLAYLYPHAIHALYEALLSLLQRLELLLGLWVILSLLQRV